MPADVDRMAEARTALSFARTALDDPAALDPTVCHDDDNPVSQGMRDAGHPDAMTALWWIDEAMELLTPA